MLDNLFSIKEASKILDCSTQNIYRKKNFLISKNYMEQDQFGNYFINTNGINYLQEIRIKTLKSSNQDFASVDKQSVANSSNPTNSTIKESSDVIIYLQNQISDLKSQIEDLKIEREDWKKKFEDKDLELQKTNAHLQDMNTTVFQKLLATEEQNRKQEEITKKGFFHRIFG